MLSPELNNPFEKEKKRSKKTEELVELFVPELADAYRECIKGKPISFEEEDDLSGMELTEEEQGVLEEAKKAHKIEIKL